MIPKWLESVITDEAFTLSPEQLEKLNTNSRLACLWKYIVMNVLRPKPPKYSDFITQSGDFFMISDNEKFKVKTY